MKQARAIWVDNIKLFACILVVLGHFFQSMVASGILADSGMYQWFNRTIYYFHVPLFFICSGYLYQRTGNVSSFASWQKNAKKKLLTLGVPYFTFSPATWLLKNIFSSSVNQETEGLLYCLFVHPQSPYWYLYILFFLFLLIPTFTGRKQMWIALAAAGILKIAHILGVQTGMYSVNVLMEYSIWFVLGMYVYVAEIPMAIGNMKRPVCRGTAAGVVFLISSVGVQFLELDLPGLDFLLGMLACAAVLLIMVNETPESKQSKVLAAASRYTMPIFLMHTIFAAGLRSVLLKIGIDNGAIHIILGVLASFAGPVIAAEMMKRIKWMEFFLYPGKFIRWK